MSAELLHLLIRPDGSVRCLYDEVLELGLLGEFEIQRASHVEPDEQGCWWAEMSPVSGPKLGPFSCRSQTLQAEHRWLTDHWLLRSA